MRTVQVVLFFSSRPCWVLIKEIQRWESGWWLRTELESEWACDWLSQRVGEVSLQNHTTLNSSRWRHCLATMPRPLPRGGGGRGPEGGGLRSQWRIYCRYGERDQPPRATPRQGMHVRSEKKLLRDHFVSFIGTSGQWCHVTMFSCANGDVSPLTVSYSTVMSEISHTRKNSSFAALWI